MEAVHINLAAFLYGYNCPLGKRLLKLAHSSSLLLFRDKVKSAITDNTSASIVRWSLYKNAILLLMGGEDTWIGVKKSTLQTKMIAIFSPISIGSGK